MPTNNTETQPDETNNAEAQEAERTPATPASSDRSPISRAIHKTRSVYNDTANSIVQTGESAQAFTQKILRTEIEPVEEVGILATPFYAVGQVADGTALNTLRRGVEVLEPAVSGLRASYRATVGAILSPIKTILHPMEYVKNPIRMVSSAITLALNTAKIPIRTGHEFIDRSISRTTQQINYKIEAIPAIGPIVARPTNWIIGITSRISGAVSKTLDWATSPVDYVHKTVAPA